MLSASIVVCFFHILLSCFRVFCAVNKHRHDAAEVNGSSDAGYKGGGEVVPHVEGGALAVTEEEDDVNVELMFLSTTSRISIDTYSL